MATIYSEIPHNIHAIEHCLITEKEQSVKELIFADKIYFYDACSLRCHAQLSSPMCIFDFIKHNNGVIVLTRCVLMELASHSGILNSEYVEYIQKIKEANIKILLVNEEIIFDVLAQCFSTNAAINRFLAWAVKVVKRPTGTVADVLREDRDIQNCIMSTQCTERTLFERFFSKVRNHKESGDNLGEELLVICLHMLANIPEEREYRLVVLTDDKGAIGLTNKASKNVFEHKGKYVFSALTTPRLVQRMYEVNILNSKQEVEEVLSVVSSDGVIKVFGSEEYDLDIKEKVMSCGELAEKIVTPNGIHINY